jgi:cell wall-associated NlpC family hydrolase
MPATAARRRSLVAVCFTLLTTVTVTLLMVLSTAAPADALTRAQRAHKVHHGLHVAAKQIGDPYRDGATGPRSFDCSGLTLFSFRRAGLYLPRSSDDQARYARHILRKNMRRGDLMFFTSGGHVYHVGIFLGRQHGHPIILHAPRSGERVHRERVWTNHWFPGTLRYR